MSIFTPHYCMERRGGAKHLVTELNARDYGNSVEFIQLNEEITDPKDLKKIADDAAEFLKNPPLGGQGKRQARLDRSRARAGLTSPGVADISEVDPSKVVEAPVRAPEPLLRAPPVDKEAQTAARKEAREKRDAARKASAEAEKKALAAAAAADAE